MNLMFNVMFGVNGVVLCMFDMYWMSQLSGFNGLFSYEIDLWGWLVVLCDVVYWEVDVMVVDFEVVWLLLIGMIVVLYWQIGYLNWQIVFGDVNIVYVVCMFVFVWLWYVVGVVLGFDFVQVEQSFVV